MTVQLAITQPEHRDMRLTWSVSCAVSCGHGRTGRERNGTWLLECQEEHPMKRATLLSCYLRRQPPPLLHCPHIPSLLMGNIFSCCESCCLCIHQFPLPRLNILAVQSRNSQSYEPLLLENEREAVADLLQYLESACSLPTGRSNTYPYSFQKTGRQPTFSPAHHSPR